MVRIGAAAPPAVDLTRPLYAQVADLGDAYLAWVHAPVRPPAPTRPDAPWPDSLRIFASDRLERLTHISWRTVVALWVPVSVALTLAAWRAADLDPADVAGWWLAGLLGWTLFEYVLHRWCFHVRPRTAWQIRAHFLAHGIHHLDPQDPTRLLFPPLAGVGLAALLFLGFAALLPLGPALAALGGLLAGYLAYDLSHYASHHLRLRGPWFAALRRRHLAHHHRDPDRLFGVSSPLWDLILGTDRR